MDIVTKPDRPPVSLQLFGEPLVVVDGDAAVTLRSRPARLLLACLLLESEDEQDVEATNNVEAERTISYKTLKAKVWPEGCDDSNLRHRLGELRTLLGEDAFIQPSRDRLRLNLARLSVDILKFERFLNQNPPDYAQAVRLYHGDFLPAEELGWVVEARKRFQAEYQQALEALALTAEAGKDYVSQENCLIRLVALDPTKKQWQLALMKLYVSQKDVSAARKAYQKYTKALPKGMLPDAEMKKLLTSLNRARSEARSHQQETQNEQPDETPAWYGLPDHWESLIGRENELRTISTAFDLFRLVTLTGPPGIGKTQLAIHAAAQRHKEHDEEGAFVDLTAVTTSDQLLQKVALAVGAPLPRDARADQLKGLIFDILREKRFTLVLDNCEQLPKPISNLANALLRECEHLHILATSQTDLRDVRGGKEIEVHPLMVPEQPLNRQLAPSIVRQLPTYPAVELFLKAAKAASSNFALNANNAWAVAGLCHLLGGLPLAIKIAAGLLSETTLEEIFRLLKSEHRLLDAKGGDLPVRHRTLRVALDASFNLLPPAMAPLFVSLAVFQGGWTLDAVRSVLGENAEGSLKQLKARFLIIGRTDGEAIATSRFRLLEPIQRFCADHLADYEEESAVRTRHLQYYAHLAESLEADLAGPHQDRVLAQLESERDNIDSALAWAAGRGDKEYGLRLAGAIWRFWYVRGGAKEGIERLDALLASYSAVNGIYAKALRGAGNLAFQRRDLSRARSIYEKQFVICKAIQDERGMANSLGSLGNVASIQDDLDTAEDSYCQSLTIFRTLQEKSLIARALDNLAIVACKKQEYTAACELHRESIDLFRELGDRHNTAIALNNLVYTEEKLGNNFAAIQLLRESLTMSQALEDQHSLVYCLILHLFLAVQLGLYERAALLVGASDVQRERLGLPLQAIAVTEYHSRVETIRLHVGHHDFDRLVAKGRATDLNAVLDHTWKAFDRFLANSAFEPLLEP